MKTIKIDEKTHRLLMARKIKYGYKNLSETIKYLIKFRDIREIQEHEQERTRFPKTIKEYREIMRTGKLPENKEFQFDDK